MTGTRTKPGTATATVQCTVHSPTRRADSATPPVRFCQVAHGWCQRRFLPPAHQAAARDKTQRGKECPGEPNRPSPSGTPPPCGTPCPGHSLQNPRLTTRGGQALPHPGRTRNEGERNKKGQPLVIYVVLLVAALAVVGAFVWNNQTTAGPQQRRLQRPPRLASGCYNCPTSRPVGPRTLT